MTLSFNKIAIANPPDTVLDYGVTTNPNPLQISTTGSITIAVSKAHTPTATCTSLSFTLAVGTSPSTLTASASNITTTITSSDPNDHGWTVTPDGLGTFTCTPSPGQGQIGEYSLTLTLNNIAINGEVGTTLLNITENLTTGTTSTTLPLSKFPPNFTVSDLTANYPSVPPGGSVTLLWSGSPGNYTLNYQGITIENLPNSGNQVIPDLEQNPTVFTLTVSASSGSNIVTLQRQVIVTILQPAIATFGLVGETLQYVAANSPLNLYWTTNNADHCTLTLNGSIIALSLPKNSTSYSITAPSTSEFANYVLYPCDANNNEYASRGFTITIYSQPTISSEINFYNTYVAPHSDQILISPDNSTLYTTGLTPTPDLKVKSLPLLAIATHQGNVVQTTDSIKSNLDGQLGIVTLLFHSNSIALSPDGTHLYGALGDNKILVMDTSTYQVTTAVQADVAISFKGITIGQNSTNYYLIASDVYFIYVYDPANHYTLVNKIALPSAPPNPPPSNEILLLNWSNNQKQNQFLLCTGNLYSYTLENPNNITQIEIIDPHPIYILSPDGNYYYAYSLISSKIDAVEIGTNSLINSIAIAVEDRVSQMVCSPNGVYLYVASFPALANGTFQITVYATATMQSLATLSVPTDNWLEQGPALAINQDGSYLYLGLGGKIAIINI